MKKIIAMTTTVKTLNDLVDAYVQQAKITHKTQIKTSEILEKMDDLREKGETELPFSLKTGTRS
jgi:hypothetical protein